MTMLNLVIFAKLIPTKPPSKLFDVPVTGPEDFATTISEALNAANPPTMLFAPVLVTEPDEVEFVMAPPR